MDLYDYHKDPQSLYKYSDLHNPEEQKKLDAFWENVKEYQNKGKGLYVIASKPDYSYQYARYTGKRFPDGEAAIARTEYWAYAYAKDIIKGEFPEAEPIIAKDPYVALDYAKYIIKGRFPEGEKVISILPITAREYAIDVIKGRFPSAEERMKKYPESWKKYTTFLKSKGIDI